MCKSYKVCATGRDWFKGFNHIWEFHIHLVCVAQDLRYLWAATTRNPTNCTYSCIADKHPTINATVQKEKGSIVENIKDANVHQRSVATQQDNITKDTKDNLINFSSPKIVETTKDHRIIQKCSQDEAVVQIVDLLQEYQTLFPLNCSRKKGMVEELEGMKLPLWLHTKPSQQQLLAWHYQYIRVKPSIEGRLILQYDSRVFKHPCKLKKNFLRPYTIAQAMVMGTT